MPYFRFTVPTGLTKRLEIDIREVVVHIMNLSIIIVQ